MQVAQLKLKQEIDSLTNELASKYQELLMASLISKPQKTDNEELTELVRNAFTEPNYKIDAFTAVNQKHKLPLYKFRKIVDKLLKSKQLTRDYESVEAGHPKLVRTK